MVAVALCRAIAVRVVGCALALTVTGVHADYVLSEVSRPGATTTALFDINNQGRMVGYSSTGTGPTDFATGFVYDGVAYTSISGPTGAIGSNALGISDTGIVVGSYFSSYTTDPSGTVVLGPQRGFVYNTATLDYTVFDVAGAGETFLRGISADGRYLTGYYSTATQAGVGFVYDTLLGAFSTMSLPGSLITIPQGVTNAGIVVGSDLVAGPPTTGPGFFYDTATGTRTDVAVAAAQRTALRAIDEAGVVAGWFRDGVGDTHGFVGSVSAFEQIDFAGADATFVEGSNNDRTLVGNFLVGSRSGAFIAQRVPEPGSLALLGMGLLSLIGGRARARRSTTVSAV